MCRGDASQLDTSGRDDNCTTDSLADHTYDLELGGLGAEIIAAVTNIYIDIDATLLGADCETVRHTDVTKG